MLVAGVHFNGDATKTLQIGNSIIAGNNAVSGNQNINGTYTIVGNNLITFDATLGPLADNGGPTWTHLPLTGSPAIDAGTNAIATARDARGIGRPQGNIADIGAVELIVDANESPTAADDSVNTSEDTAITFDPRAGDTDPDGDTLSVKLIHPPTYGFATVDSDQLVTYTPSPDFFGSDQLVYQITDRAGEVDTATVSLSVTPQNDAPSVVDDNVEAIRETSVDIAVLANDIDVDGDAFDVESFTQPANGTVTDNGDGTLAYVGNTGFIGTDTFTYTATDGSDVSVSATVALNVSAIPVANDDSYNVEASGQLSFSPGGVPITSHTILDNDSDDDGDVLTAVLVTDPVNGTLTLQSDGSVTYVADPGYTGPDYFIYRAVDSRGLQSDPATVSLNVTGVNESPIVTAITALDPLSTFGSTVRYQLDFNEAVYLDSSNLSLVTTGFSGATIVADAEQNGGPSSYIVTVNVSGGNGTIQLQVIDDNATKDFAGLSLGGTAIGDGNFTTAETYTVETNPLRDIVGDVFIDTDLDGQRDGGELGAVGQSVYLDANNNGSLDTGETIAITDAAGHYVIADIPLGTYTVSVAPSAGWFTTAASTGSATLEFTGGAVSLDLGIEENLTQISGIVYQDDDAGGSGKQAKSAWANG